MTINGDIQRKSPERDQGKKFFFSPPRQMHRPLFFWKQINKVSISSKKRIHTGFQQTPLSPPQSLSHHILFLTESYLNNKNCLLFNQVTLFAVNEEFAFVLIKIKVFILVKSFFPSRIQ